MAAPEPVAAAPEPPPAEPEPAPAPPPNETSKTAAVSPNEPGRGARRLASLLTMLDLETPSSGYVPISAAGKPPVATRR